MNNLLSRHFNKLELGDGFYNIGVHPVMENVLTATLSDVRGRVGVPANRWAMDVYTDKLSAIITSADRNGVYFNYYSVGRVDGNDNGSYSLHATWEDLGIHPSAVGNAIINEYLVLFRGYVITHFFKFFLGLGSRSRRVALRWLHDIKTGDYMWGVGKNYKVIRQGNLYNIYRDSHRVVTLIEIERITVNMFR